MIELIPAFSFPIWQSFLPDFENKKNEILDTITEFKNENPISENVSGLNGYQSPKNLHQKENLSWVFNHICSLGLQCANDLNFCSSNIFITSSWININNSRNCINSPHVHTDVFSGVIYLKTPEESGELVIHNPGINPLWPGCFLSDSRNQFTAQSIKIKPNESEIIIWPSYFNHMVDPNRHDEERISLSFNITLIPKDEDDYLKVENNDY